MRAAPKSGSLITARHVLELGRDVYAVPGNIFDQKSSGTNSLIRDGALPVQRAEEIIESLPCRVQERLPQNVEGAGAKAPAGSDPACASVFEAVTVGQTVTQDELAASTGLSAHEVAAHLLILELEGLIRRYPGPAYCRSK